MNIGTLSGLDVLTVGTVEPGAEVKLKDGSTGVVISVKRRWLSLRPPQRPNQAAGRHDHEGLQRGHRSRPSRSTATGRGQRQRGFILGQR